MCEIIDCKIPYLHGYYKRLAPKLRLFIILKINYPAKNWKNISLQEVWISGTIWSFLWSSRPLALIALFIVKPLEGNDADFC